MPKTLFLGPVSTLLSIAVQVQLQLPLLRVMLQLSIEVPKLWFLAHHLLLVITNLTPMPPSTLSLVQLDWVSSLEVLLVMSCYLHSAAQHLAVEVPIDLAEALALKLRISLAWDASIWPLYVESDCLSNINNILAKHFPRTEVGLVLEEIVYLLYPSSVDSLAYVPQLIKVLILLLS
ncbi:hypothetical protein ACOSP7_026661 [Xanthoceras sorbifolium]